MTPLLAVENAPRKMLILVLVHLGHSNEKVV